VATIRSRRGKRIAGWKVSLLWAGLFDRIKTQHGCDLPEFPPDRPAPKEIELHYYQFNIGDYRRDTFHLSLLEHGVYRQLLDTYYLHEKPLHPDVAVVMRTHSARTKDEKAAILSVLENFFLLTDEGWIHRGCEKTIEKYREKSAKARVSAESRWCKRNANASETHCEGNANHKPITNNHKPIKTKAVITAPPDGVSIEVWDSFIAIRKAKRAPMTSVALEGIRREAAKAGIGLQEALAVCCTRGWQSFKADWHQQQQTESQRAREHMAELTRGMATPKPKNFWEKTIDETNEVIHVETKRLL
jgi:uncharacterized protein YdaU (DUF1376 family)